jgi:hypothetical protein
MSEKSSIAIVNAGEGWVRLTSSDGETLMSVYETREGKPIVLAYSGEEAGPEGERLLLYLHAPEYDGEEAKRRYEDDTRRGG